MEYTREEMFDLNLYWQFREPVVFKVKKPGGLSIGYHDVKLQFGWVLNYNGELEKEFDGSGLGNSFIFDPNYERRMLLCR